MRLKLTLLFLFFYGLSSAQQGPVLRDSVAIRFEPPGLEAAFPFRHIEVVDFRSDTSKIGYVKKKNKDCRLMTPGTLANHIAQLLNEAVKNKIGNGSEPSALVVIKNFWLKTPTESDWRRKRGVDGRELKSLWGWHVKFEVYGESQGSYTPLFRLDSLYGFDEFDERNTIANDALNHCLSRLQSIDVNRLKSAKTKYTRQAVDSFNQAAFSKPVLVDHSLPTGVFLTFSDFINGRTAYTDFAIETTANVDNLYVLKNNNKELLTNFWGFCDGKKYYIRANRNFYELYQQGNTFEFIGHELLVLPGIRTGGLSPGVYNSGMEAGAQLATGVLVDAITGPSGGRSLFRRFQLNMENGQIY